MLMSWCVKLGVIWVMMTMRVAWCMWKVVWTNNLSSQVPRVIRFHQSVLVAGGPELMLGLEVVPEHPSVHGVLDGLVFISPVKVAGPLQDTWQVQGVLGAPHGVSNCWLWGMKTSATATSCWVVSMWARMMSHSLQHESCRVRSRTCSSSWVSLFVCGQQHAMAGYGQVGTLRHMQFMMEDARSGVLLEA